MHRTAVSKSPSLLARAATVLVVLGLGINANATVPAAVTPPAVKLGYVPNAGVNGQARGAELATLIASNTGVKVQVVAGSSYPELAQKLAKKEIDFAFLSALSFVESEKQVRLKVLLKKVWDQGYYYSVFLTKKSSSLRKLADLKGKRIAFVDANSASGFLYPQVFLKEFGLDLKRDAKSVVLSGSHEKSVELLKRGEVDVIATYANDKLGKDSAWTHQQGRASDVRVIWASVAIPNDPFCVRQEFYDAHPKTTHDLMFGLIEMSEDPVAGASLKKILDVAGFMVATSQQFEPVREMFRTLNPGDKTP